MRLNGFVACLVLVVCATGVAAQKQIVIAASTVFDGKGGVYRNDRH